MKITVFIPEYFRVSAMIFKEKIGKFEDIEMIFHLIDDVSMSFDIEELYHLYEIDDVEEVYRRCEKAFDYFDQLVRDEEQTESNFIGAIPMPHF